MYIQCVNVFMYIWCLWAFCLRLLCTSIIATSKVVTVYSLQLSAVVLPPMLLQMVNKSALVQLLDPQWPTLVTKGTPCKEPTDVPAWPMENGVGVRLLAIVSCSLFYSYFYMGIKSPSGQRYCTVMTVGGSPGFCRHRADQHQVEWQYTCSASFQSNYAQCMQLIVTYNVTYTRPLWLVAMPTMVSMMHVYIVDASVCCFVLNI